MAEAKTFDEMLNKSDGSDLHVVFKTASIEKVSEELGLVFGWGIVCEKDGQPYYDSQGDNIPFDVMVKATSDFMTEGRVAKDMHNGDQIGCIVHSMPMTPDIAKSYGIGTNTYGWMVAMKPSPEVLKQFKSGERTGFSIGGSCTYELENA